ncbi:hypothetical protein [Dethiosulfatarculus sandiegensis]|uniref:Uncharacterized protein n=1 Tax=Dethiosulfatarculus sandiegensis TaxID=1429043 RepID=A0A0D2GN78_9BACT|nr:hypothetical protein [Dethiosulfatarculus sandiegensis]KIX16087.1 hypothetical protein X474_01120 [Dethiosulfatarculus sandiegensis]
MPLDYTEITIGPPGKVIDRLTRRIGELNFNSKNIRIGITRCPSETFDSLNGKLKWAAMKLVYATSSSSQAVQVGQMLRSWDAKLYVDTKEVTPDLGPNQAYYAFVVIR